MYRVRQYLLVLALQDSYDKIYPNYFYTWSIKYRCIVFFKNIVSKKTKTIVG